MRTGSVSIAPMTATTTGSRRSRFMPGGVPKYIHVYDDGRPGERYTVVFTGRYTSKTSGQHWYIGASAHPYHPQGFGTVGESRKQIDSPIYGHLGKKISWKDLPPDVKKFVISVYSDLWDL